MNNVSGNILLAAGGTGGHLFPAIALARELVKHGAKVHLATDSRGTNYCDYFSSEIRHIIFSASLSSRHPVTLFKGLCTLFSGYRQSRILLKKLRPNVVVGFGGYPSVPPVLAASRMGIPVMLHEQNAIMGRANRFLESRADLIATGFARVKGLKNTKQVETGNPVRPIVTEMSRIPYPIRQSEDVFNLLVFGGSQGARFLSKIFVETIPLFSEAQRQKIRIVQQARIEDHDELLAVYRNYGVQARVAAFFDTMPEEMSKAHLVVARAGASTITELVTIGRPALLVPLPGSLDGDQALNAAAMKSTGGALVEIQAKLTPKKFHALLTSAVEYPKRFAKMAQLAQKLAKPNAASVLADCVVSLARQHNPTWPMWHGRDTS